MKKRRQAARFRGLGTGPLKTNKQAQSASGSRGSGHHNNPARSPEPSPRAGPGRVALTFPMAWTQQAEQPGSVSRAPGLVPLSIPLCGPRSVALTAAADGFPMEPLPGPGTCQPWDLPGFALFLRLLFHESSLTSAVPGWPRVNSPARPMLNCWHFLCSSFKGWYFLPCLGPYTGETHCLEDL